jgi:hypothetical protein
MGLLIGSAGYGPGVSRRGGARAGQRQAQACMLVIVPCTAGPARGRSAARSACSPADQVRHPARTAGRTASPRGCTFALRGCPSPPSEPVRSRPPARWYFIRIAGEDGDATTTVAPIFALWARTVLEGPCLLRARSDVTPAVKDRWWKSSNLQAVSCGKLSSAAPSCPPHARACVTTAHKSHSNERAITGYKGCLMALKGRAECGRRNLSIPIARN